MIGQINFMKQIDDLIQNKKFPAFSIITGPKGFGKKIAAKWIASQFGSDYQIYQLPDVKVDTIRDMIEESYKQRKPTIIIIPDADSMSVSSKNAILKVAEEPPNNIRIIMTLENLNNTLPTIKSRAAIYYMDSYSVTEIITYFKSIVDNYSDNELKLMSKLAGSPGEVNLLIESDIEKFYEYVEKVIDNIAEVSGSNAFKIAGKVSLKEEGSGYDLRMFFKIFNQICLDRLTEGDTYHDWGSAIKITTEAINQLSIKGINKLYIMDIWILEVRKIWM